MQQMMMSQQCIVVRMMHSCLECQETQRPANVIQKYQKLLWHVEEDKLKYVKLKGQSPTKRLSYNLLLETKMHGCPESCHSEA